MPLKPSDAALTRARFDGIRTSDLNVLALNTDLPVFPGGGGVEFLTMKGLAARARVGLVSMAHTREDLDRSRTLADAGVGLYLWHSPWLDRVPAPVRRRSLVRATHRMVRRLAEAALARPGRPSEARVMDAAFSNMAPALIQALSERPWHVLAVVQSHAAVMIDYMPRPLVSVLVMHDIRARLYERWADVSLSTAERWHLRREARRYRAFEREYSRRFDLVVTVSAEDARWVREQYRPARVYHLPLPVDAGYFAPRSPALEHAGRIIFTGLMNHPPNVDAAVYFATDVLPHVRARIPSAEFHIVGRNPVERVSALGRQPGVRVFADVPDIRLHIAEASVVVAPLRYGSGARQKILEAWSMEKCVVATSIGAEGLEYEHGVNLLVADATSELAGAVTAALSTPEVRDRLRQAGRSVVRSHHDPEGLAAGYFNELEALAVQKAALDVPMRVLLDMRWMVPGLAGGIENLARAFFLQLTTLDGYNAYTALVPARCRFDFDLHGRSNFQIVSLDSASVLLRREWNRLLLRARASLRLHDWRTPQVRDLQWLRDLGVEIAYSFPGYIHPQVFPLRQVLVMPDIQHEYLPELFSPGALEERRRVYTDSVRRADHICAISEFTRRTLIDKLAVPAEKVTTVLLAADPRFTPRSAEARADARVLESYGLEPGAYLYFPAHTWHHKNHRVAIDALRVLRDRHGMNRTLVCSGGAREAQSAIDAHIVKSGLGGQVRFLGYCPGRELPALYRGAAGLLFPSLFEGFGMPVLEAMASGCPVVCSNTTSLPEIAGDAALLVDPNDPEALAAAVHRVLTDPDLRLELVARGLQRAAAFSWQRHTLETIAVFRRVHDQMRRR
jgi:glycosyltransferase involved in cell wall biosynthesis